MQPLHAPASVDPGEAIIVMQRRELKYVLAPEQIDYLLPRLDGRLDPDPHGRSTVSTLYYDTPDRRLIRASLEKPRFKEKIRLRAYGSADNGTPVFLELKRKMDGVVYKRRVKTTIPLAERFMSHKCDVCAPGQIGRELKAFRDRYETLLPACLILYERTAFETPEDGLRLTIDENPRFRTDHLSLTHSADGASLLPPGCAILEIKLRSAMPLWLAHTLSEGQIYKQSYSKYGEAYIQQQMQVNRKE